MANHLIAHLAHVELLTPRLEESLWFFKDLLAMYPVGRDGESLLLRAWGEFSVPFSLKLTPSDKAGLGHVSWRTESAEDLATIASQAEAEKSSLGWSSEVGHAKVFRFTDPEGHVNEAFWEMKGYVAEGAAKSRVKARPMKMPSSTLAVSRLDHCTLFCNDIKSIREFYERYGFKHNEGTFSSSHGRELGAFMTVTGRSHDLGLLRDASGAKGRLNHIAFGIENTGAWLAGCDVLVENGILLEMGPIRHGLTDSLGIYVIEPGGNRIEIFNGGYLNFTPRADWKAVMTDVDKPEGKYGTVWGMGLLVESWLTYGTPQVEMTEQLAQEMQRLSKLRRQNPYDSTTSSFGPVT